MHLATVCARKGCAALVLLVSFLAAPALADTVTVSPIAWNSARDGGTTLNPFPDGQFDTLQGGNILLVSKSPSNVRRAGYEFLLPPAVMQPGVTINSMKLTVPVAAESLMSTVGNTFVAHGYSGDSVLTVDDFEVNNPIGALTLWTQSPAPARTIDIVQWVQSLPGGANNRLGIVVEAVTVGTSAQWRNTSTLQINYTPSVGTPPTLDVISPQQNATFVAGDQISLQATSWDNEDGNRDWAIQWTSSLAGTIANGGNALVQLGVGTHVITAKIIDTHGNTAAKSRSITVQAVANTAPTVNILSPANGAQLIAGEAVTLQGHAVDAQEGPVSSAIQWLLNGVVSLGGGANASVQFPAGSHTLVARVIDGGGLVGEASINVNVVTPLPPAGYCDARGSYTGSEWIDSVSVANITHPSGPNGGYGDFTATQFPIIKGIGNTITLAPGYGTGVAFNEFWSVWVDLNRDSVFSPEEVVVSGSGNTPIARTFTVPDGVANGQTRMRIAMSYGAPVTPCGTFNYGEVEDYTVEILGGINPPPGPTYCASRASTSSYEWLAQATIAGTTRVTGNNAGYGDFSSGAAIALIRGINSFSFSMGYSGSAYTEQFMVWIDFNRDGLFGNEDWVYGGSGAFSVNGTFTVPAGAPSGTTRMRVQMKYGAAATPCETFNYGEVEDYAVQIP